MGVGRKTTNLRAKNLMDTGWFRYLLIYDANGNTIDVVTTLADIIELVSDFVE